MEIDSVNVYPDQLSEDLVQVPHLTQLIWYPQQYPLLFASTFYQRTCLGPLSGIGLGLDLIST